jgi:hypothetical protein
MIKVTKSIISFLAILAINNYQTNCVPNCSSNETLYNGNCYLFFQTKMTHPQGQAYCASLNPSSTLIYIDSIDDEPEWLKCTLIPSSYSSSRIWVIMIYIHVISLLLLSHYSAFRLV